MLKLTHVNLLHEEPAQKHTGIWRIWPEDLCWQYVLWAWCLYVTVNVEPGIVQTSKNAPLSKAENSEYKEVEDVLWPHAPKEKAMAGRQDCIKGTPGSTTAFCSPVA